MIEWEIEADGSVMSTTSITRIWRVGGALRIVEFRDGEVWAYYPTTGRQMPGLLSAQLWIIEQMAKERK